MINENYEQRPFRRGHRGSFGFAAVLILVGISILLVNTGIIPTEYRSLLTAWPIWLIIAGLITAFNRHWGSSIVLFVVGIFFMMPFLAPIRPDLGIPSNFVQLYWPVLMIFAGLIIVVERLFHKRIFCHGVCRRRYSSTTTNEDGYIYIDSAFDSKKSIFLDPVFKGGKIESSFGEVILDLRKTTLAEGDIRLDVEVSFGSATIIVPDTWNVKVVGDAVFGTFNDQRLTHNYFPDEPRKLTIAGKVAFGECQVKD